MKLSIPLPASALAFPLALVFATAAQAQAIYKCVDANGQTSFSGSPCTAAQTPVTVRFKDKVIDVGTAGPRARRSAGTVAMGGTRPASTPPSPKP